MVSLEGDMAADMLEGFHEVDVTASSRRLPVRRNLLKRTAIFYVFDRVIVSPWASTIPPGT